MDALKLLEQTTKDAEAREARARASSSASLHLADPNLVGMKAAERMLRDVVVMFLVNRASAPSIFIEADAAGD